MRSITQCVRDLFRRAPWPELKFPTTGFETINDDFLLEEESLRGFNNKLFFPVRIGEVFASRYQIVGKLGFGVTSTVWLARDLPNKKYAALKFYTKRQEECKEFETYKVLSGANTKHPGHRHIRPAYDKFKIARPGGDHWCLVQEPMCDSLGDFVKRTENYRLTTDLLRMILIQILYALDYVHTECKLVHTDIKLDNIFIETYDQTIFDEFVEWEMKHPVVRKLGEHPLYGSRSFRRPKDYGAIMLGDFGASARGDMAQTYTIQPDQYRCPEVLFNRPWGYAADIWNVGVMVWSLFEDQCLFSGLHPDGSGYSPTAHVAEVIAVLGPPPLEWLEDPRTKSLFDSNGNWISEIPIPSTRTLGKLESNLCGDEQVEFLEFMRGMLQWRPADRMTARQLLDHPWLKAQELWVVKY